MTLTAAGPRRGATAVGPEVRRRRDLVVPLAVVAVVLLRLVFVAAPMAPDEGGYLAVAAQWHAHGTSLYGNYWVDRPPLLIAVFGLASHLGGLTALRLLGSLAAALTVVGAAAAAGRVAGLRARRTTAALTALLLSTPLLGAVPVNGELLSAPLIAGALLTAVAALDAVRRRNVLLLGIATGALSVAALLVKQNMVDGIVVAAACWTVAWVRHSMSWRRWCALVVAAAVGSGTVLALVLWVAHLLGTSPGGLYDAMYPFRVAAAHVLAKADPATSTPRLLLLLATWAAFGIPILTAILAWRVLSGRARRAAHAGVLAMLVVATASTFAGGSFWTHYLIELVVPTAVAVGVLVGDRVRGVRLLAAAMALVAFGGWLSGFASTSSTRGTAVGHSIAAVARPGDTVFSAFGDASVVRTSGLRSPYPYLWSLPTQTLDPKLRHLRHLMAGPTPPTWLVVRGPGTQRELHHRLGSVLPARYHRVGRICERNIYLLNGVSRPRLHRLGACRGSLTGTVGPHWFSQYT